MTVRILIPCCLTVLLSTASAEKPAKPRLDANGVPLPVGAVARLGNSRFVAPDLIKAIAASPDGKRIATAYGADVHIWDTDKARIVCEINTHIKLSEAVPFHPNFQLKWSRNGKMLAVLTGDGSLSLHDPANGEAFWHRKADRYSTHSIAVKHANWSGEDMHFLDNDRTLALALDTNHVELWDVARGAHVRTWNVDAEKKARLKIDEWAHYSGVTLSPSGSRMVWTISISSDPYRSIALIYDTISGKLLREVKDLPLSRRTDLLDEGETLLLQSFPEDDTIQPTLTIVSTADIKQQIKLNVPKDRSHDLDHHRLLNWRLRPLAFGKSLWLQDKFGLTRWDPINGKLLDQLNPGFIDLAVSADGKRLAASRGRRLYVCDGDVDALLKSNDFWDYPRQLAFQADGTLMAKSETIQYPGGLVTVFDPLKSTVLSSQFTPVLYRAGPHRMDDAFKVLAKFDKEGIVLTNLADGKPISRLQVTKDVPRDWNAIHVSGDGMRVLTWEWEREKHYRFRWFDSATGRELGRFEAPFREIFPRSGGYASEYWTPITWFAHDGSAFGFRTLDSRFTVVDCNTGKVERNVGISRPMTWNQASAGWGRSPKWDYWKSPGSQLYFAASLEDAPAGEYAVWDRDGNMLRHFSLANSRIVSPSTDGRLVANRDKQTIRFYETATGRKIGHIDTGVDDLRYSNLSISPDNKLLAITCSDTTILVWDINRQLSNKPALPSPKAEKEAEALWERLGDADPAEANPAVWALVRGPTPALTLLKERLQRVEAPDPKRLQMLINQLNAETFQERDAANWRPWAKWRWTRFELR